MPNDDEHRLYDLVSAYLQRENLAALLAVAGTHDAAAPQAPGVIDVRHRRRAEKLVGRLEQAERLQRLGNQRTPELALTAEDFDVVDELADEWSDGEDEQEGVAPIVPPAVVPRSNRERLRRRARPHERHQYGLLVVHYDLPWNPQCIEQQIGRCHRGGQRVATVSVLLVPR